MSPPQQTYTPAQYLEAGYRAEMAGDHERAAQYYRYLAEVFANSPEGEAAAAGLVRITAQTPHHPQPAPYQQQPAPRQQPAPQRQPARPAASQAPAADRAANPRIRLGELAHHDLTQRPAPAQQHQPAAHLRPQPAGHPPATAPSHAHSVAEQVADTDGDDAMRLPEVVARRAREMADLDDHIHIEPRYRGARVMAYMLTWLGWIVLAGGLAFVVLGFIGVPSSLSGAVVGLPGGIVIGIAGIIGGLALALGGQVALATFDQAQSLREIGIVLRAHSDL